MRILPRIPARMPEGLAPPMRMLRPRPPASTLLPGPPTRTLLPPPPIRTSSPAPPNRRLGRVALDARDGGPWRKVMEPVGMPAAAGRTVAVKVTTWLKTEGFRDEVTLVEVEAGVTVSVPLTKTNV